MFDVCRRQGTAFQIAADMHLEAESMAGVDELRGQERLVRLATHQTVLLAQAPASVVTLPSVRGQASLDNLAIRRFDVAEEAVRAAHERARLDLARRREESPDSPFQPVVERRRLSGRRERVEGGVRRVLRRRTVERDRHDAGPPRIRERRAEVIEKDLELRDAACA